MTVLDHVEDFVKRCKSAICDDCLAQKLSLSVRQHANHKTRQLAESADFVRQKAPCSFCGSRKLVIRTA